MIRTIKFLTTPERAIEISELELSIERDDVYQKARHRVDIACSNMLQEYARLRFPWTIFPSATFRRVHQNYADALREFAHIVLNQGQTALGRNLMELEELKREQQAAIKEELSDK